MNTLEFLPRIDERLMPRREVLVSSRSLCLFEQLLGAHLRKLRYLVLREERAAE
jgi:hypothetical protein